MLKVIQTLSLYVWETTKKKTYHLFGARLDGPQWMRYSSSPFLGFHVLLSLDPDVSIPQSSAAFRASLFFCCNAIKTEDVIRLSNAWKFPSFQQLVITGDLQPKQIWL
jgi:hypothetical protein